MGLKTNFHPLNVVDSVDKKVPPLTEFEEEYLSTSMIQNLSMTCSMVDAQLYLHREAIRLVQKNYRLKVIFRYHSISLPLHEKHWSIILPLRWNQFRQNTSSIFFYDIRTFPYTSNIGSIVVNRSSRRPVVLSI